MRLQTPRPIKFAWAMLKPIVALFVFMLMLCISWVANAWDESGSEDDS